MKEKYNPAIEALLDELTAQTRAVTETKKLINTLRRKIGEPPMFSDADLQDEQTPSAMREDLFYGKPLASAVREYLEMRKRACRPEEILQALEAGGFDFKGLGWNEKDRLRSLAMSMAKNNAYFHKLPNGLFGMRAWYTEIFDRKKGDEKKPKGDSNEEEQGEQGEEK
jgi:hypothetical protein